MKMMTTLWLLVMIMMMMMTRATTTTTTNKKKPSGPRKFPDGFLLGAGTSAYQVEGARNVDGKGDNIYMSTGEVACRSYDRYREDVKLLKKLNTRINISAVISYTTAVVGDIQGKLNHYHYGDKNSLEQEQPTSLKQETL